MTFTWRISIPSCVERIEAPDRRTAEARALARWGADATVQSELDWREMQDEDEARASARRRAEEKEEG